MANIDIVVFVFIFDPFEFETQKYNLVVQYFDTSEMCSM